MKTTGPISLTVLLLAACASHEPNSAQRPGHTSVEFSFALSTDRSAPMAKALQDATAALVTIESSGAPVYTAEKIALYPFNDAFLSQPLSLPPGSFELTSFVLLDAADQAIYATPTAGSNTAHLVAQPLPIPFAIATDMVTTVQPEVITTAAASPEDFGYVDFGLDDASVIEIADFLVAAFVFDDGSQTLVTTTATIAVDDDASVELYTGPLTAGTNHIRVPAGRAGYDVSVSKAGFLTWSSSFTEVELTDYFSSTGEGPLEVVLLQDIDPDPFAFTDERLLDIDTVESSNAVIVTGFTGQLTFALTGVPGATVIKNGVDTGSDSALVQPGDEVAVQMTTSSAFETATTVTASLGTYATDWSVTTAPDCPVEATRLAGSRGCLWAGGAGYSLIVPATLAEVEVKLWGAGGGGGTPPLSGCAGSNGGGGGFSSGVVAVTPGETLDVIVGSGGGDGIGGGGGGRTEVERAGQPLYVAGGGGGGSHCAAGQPGGGLSGGGGPADDGVCAPCGCAGVATGFGGFGGGATGSHQPGASHSGGGGGGYSGGVALCTGDGSGGGGSGFVAVGETGATVAGTGATPAGTADADYTPGIGAGGSPVTAGGDGQLVILWR